MPDSYSLLAQLGHIAGLPPRVKCQPLGADVPDFQVSLSLCSSPVPGTPEDPGQDLLNEQKNRAGPLPSLLWLGFFPLIWCLYCLFSVAWLLSQMLGLCLPV